MQAIQCPSSGLDHCNIDIQSSVQLSELNDHGAMSIMKYQQQKTHEKDESVESVEPHCFRGKLNFSDTGCSESSISSQSPDAIELPYHHEGINLPHKANTTQDDLVQYEFNDIPGLTPSFNFEQLDSGMPSDMMFQSINDPPLSDITDEQYMVLNIYSNPTAGSSSIPNYSCASRPETAVVDDISNNFCPTRNVPAGSSVSVAETTSVVSPNNPAVESILDDEIWRDLNFNECDQPSAKPKEEPDNRRGLGLFLPSPQYIPSSISLDGKIHQHKALSPNPIVPTGPLHLNMYTELPTSPIFARALASTSSCSPNVRGGFEGTPMKGIMQSSSVFSPRMYSGANLHGGERVSLPYGSSPRGVSETNQFIPSSSMGEHYTHQVRNRSISKMPLSRMYELMGLSKDHNKAKWREERIINLVKAEGFDVGNQTWIRDTEEATRHRIIESIYNQTRDFGYPPEILEIIVRRGTYARMQSKLRQKRRLSRKSTYYDHEVAC